MDRPTGGVVGGVAELVIRRRMVPRIIVGCTSSLLVYLSRSLDLNLLNSEGLSWETVLPKAARSKAAIWVGVLGIMTPEASHSCIVTCPAM